MWLLRRRTCQEGPGRREGAIAVGVLFWLWRILPGLMRRRPRQAGQRVEVELVRVLLAIARQVVVRMLPPGVEEGGRAEGRARGAVGLREDAVLIRHPHIKSTCGLVGSLQQVSACPAVSWALSAQQGRDCWIMLVCVIEE